MKIKKNVAISDSGFIFNPSTGDSYSTNPIGIEIIQMLKDGKSSDEINNHMLTSYQTDNASIEKDLYDFMKMLEKYKLTDYEDQKKA